MIATTRIPTHRNDGTKVTRRELRAVLALVRDAFRGYSLEPPCDGAWVAIDGQIYEEQTRKLEVIISKEDVPKARELFISIGKQLGQRAIYFEVREGGEIIDLD